MKKTISNGTFICGGYKSKKILKTSTAHSTLNVIGYGKKTRKNITAFEKSTCLASLTTHQGDKVKTKNVMLFSKI